MAYAAGVDVGSTQTKAVIIDEGGAIVSRSLTMTGANVIRAAEGAFLDALNQGGLREEEVEYVVGTGERHPAPWTSPWISWGPPLCAVSGR
jgi:activator of 2-hydroxyglutaryl-CoA dehydratase